MIRFEKVFDPQGYTSPNRLCLLQMGGHGLAFEGQDAEDAFVDGRQSWIRQESEATRVAALFATSTEDRT
jgi:hypothetical protein